MIQLVADVGVSPGRVAITIGQVNWAAWRQRAAWPMIACFGVGSIALWTSAILKLSTSGGFAGVLSWQTLGAPLPIYRGGMTAHRALKQDENGRLPPLAMRRRLWTIVSIVAVNVLCNGWVIFLVIQLMRRGEMAWSTQDKLAFAIAGGATVLLVVGKLGGLLSFDALLFWLVVTYRAIPQGLLAASPDLDRISWWTLGGVALIALQGLIVYSIELGFAKAELNDQASVAKAQWTCRAEACNSLSVLFPVAAKAFS